MPQSIKYILAILILSASAFSIKAQAAEMIYPDPAFSPKEVVTIQLKALSKINAQDNSGFVQTWIFAHPRNKAVTGPLERFAMMLQSPNYAILIGHQNHDIVDVYQKGDKAFLFVNILDSNDQLIALFRWELSLARQEDNTAVWMTTNVTRLLKPADMT